MRERLRQEVKGKRIIMRKGKAGVLAAVFAAAALLTACGNKEYLKEYQGG